MIRDTSSKPVGVVAAQAVLATNAELVDTALVPLTETDIVGNGAGLPSDPTEYAGMAIPKDWAQRQFVPTAVIRPSTPDSAVFDGRTAWQLVFGIKVINPSQRATFQQVMVMFKQGGHSYRFESQLHDVIEAPGVSSSRC